MTIRIHNQLFISFLPGDVSVPTNVIIDIGVGFAVLSMAGLLIAMVMMCVHTKRKKGSYIQGVCDGQSILLTLGLGVGVLTKLAICHPEHVSTIS